MKQNESGSIKTTVITGTTSGIGFEFCKLFANDGYRLILVSRNEQALRRQKEHFMQNGVEAEYICCSLEQTGAAKYVFDKIRETGWGIDILVNNAGFSEADSFWETDILKELEMIQLHISFMTELTKLLLTQMIEYRRGKILNIGSTGSYIPCPNSAVYGATKAYILSFSNALYSELKQKGITVTTLCPGSTATAFAQKAHLEETLLF